MVRCVLFGLTLSIRHIKLSVVSHEQSVSVPQRFIKGLAGEFLREEPGDVFPVQLNVSRRCDSSSNSWRCFFHVIFHFLLCATVFLLRRSVTVAEVTKHKACRTNNRDNRTGFEKKNTQLRCFKNKPPLSGVERGQVTVDPKNQFHIFPLLPTTRSVCYLVKRGHGLWKCIFLRL